MYKVIGPPKTRAFRVLWMLEELGQNYDVDFAAPRSETVLAYSASGKVPVLLENDVAITDSSAILTYLADKHGALTHTAGTIERAKQDSLTHMILDELDAVLWTAARHSFILPEGRRVPQVKDSLKWEFGESLARLADRIEGDWLMSDDFTIADIVLIHCLTWARAAKFEISDPRLLTYLARGMDRDAFKRASRHFKA